MKEVYIVHENVPYEFGRVRGVFLAEDAAIAHAESLTDAEELTVSRWTVSDGAPPQEEVEVWERLGRDRPGNKLT